jgi:hypothetical protein
MHKKIMLACMAITAFAAFVTEQEFTGGLGGGEWRLLPDEGIGAGERQNESL